MAQTCKLLRDNMPALAAQQGIKVKTAVLDEEAFKDLLIDQLKSDAMDVYSFAEADQILDRFVDLMLDLNTLAELRGINLDEANSMYVDKLNACGSYSGRILGIFNE